MSDDKEKRRQEQLQELIDCAEQIIEAAESVQTPEEADRVIAEAEARISAIAGTTRHSDGFAQDENFGSTQGARERYQAGCPHSNFNPLSTQDGCPNCGTKRYLIPGQKPPVVG